MDFATYEDAAVRSAIYPEAGTGDLLALTYVALGLTNEAGELAGKLKKAIRDDGGAIALDRRDAMIAELGDVLWYVAQVARELHVSLGEVAQRNVDKLASRMARNVIGGDGDQR